MPNELGSTWTASDFVSYKITTSSLHPFQVVKIDSGDYGNFGTGTNVDVQKPFLLYTNRSCCKVLAASIHWDDDQQEYTEVGQRLVIPLNYPGNCHLAS